MTKNHEKHLASALRKCHCHDRPNHVWTGCLLPVEILALVEAGVQPRQEYDVTYAQRDKEAGVCQPHWFYFVPRKVKMREAHDTNTHKS